MPRGRLWRLHVRRERPTSRHPRAFGTPARLNGSVFPTFRISHPRNVGKPPLLGHGRLIRAKRRALTRPEGRKMALMAGFNRSKPPKTALDRSRSSRLPPLRPRNGSTTVPTTVGGLESTPRTGIERPPGRSGRPDKHTRSLAPVPAPRRLGRQSRPAGSPANGRGRRPRELGPGPAGESARAPIRPHGPHGIGAGARTATPPARIQIHTPGRGGA